MSMLTYIYVVAAGLWVVFIMRKVGCRRFTKALGQFVSDVMRAFGRLFTPVDGPAGIRRRAADTFIDLNLFKAMDRDR